MMTWIIPNEKYQDLIHWAASNSGSIKKQLNRLKRKRKGEVDKIIHALHARAFERIDCLECGNCCGSLGPRLTNRDLEILSKRLGYHEEELKREYLRIDEDNDLIFNTLPCPFFKFRCELLGVSRPSEGLQNLSAY
jgi:hypothetical protein